MATPLWCCFSKRGGELSPCLSDPSFLLLLIKVGLLIYLLPPPLNADANAVGWSSSSGWWCCVPFCCLPLFSCRQNWPHELMGLSETFFLIFLCLWGSRRLVKLEYERTNEWLSYRVSSCRTSREVKERKISLLRWIYFWLFSGDNYCCGAVWFALPLGKWSISKNSGN